MLVFDLKIFFVGITLFFAKQVLIKKHVLLKNKNSILKHIELKSKFDLNIR